MPQGFCSNVFCLITVSSKRSDDVILKLAKWTFKWSGKDSQIVFWVGFGDSPKDPCVKDLVTSHWCTGNGGTWRRYGPPSGRNLGFWEHNLDSTFSCLSLHSPANMRGIWPPPCCTVLSLVQEQWAKLWHCHQEYRLPLWNWWSPCCHSERKPTDTAE